MPKKGTKKPAKAKPATARVRKGTILQKRKEVKKTVKTYTPLPSSFNLVAQVFRIFAKHWKILGGITLVYILVNIFFANGLGNVSAAYETVRLNLQLHETLSLKDGLSGFGNLLAGSAAGSSQATSVAQSFLFILESLVIIWTLRQLLAGKAVKVKEAYYGSMTPLVPFMLVIFVILLQLLPLTIGSAALSAILYSVISSNPVAESLVIIFFFILMLWSIYMISASIFAFYIVTLPDMKPRDALRSAKNLVRFRRWTVIRRVIFLPIFILVFMAVVTVPLILYASALVTPIFYLVGALALLFAHSYLYSLYRGLLK